MKDRASFTQALANDLSSVMDGMASKNATADEVAAALGVALKLEVPEKDSHQLVPGVLAKLLHKQQHNPREFASFDFEEMLSQVIGKVMIQEIPNLLSLADRMEAQGYTGDNWYYFGYADKCAILLLNEENRKALAFKTQNVNYLVFLRNKYYGWELHLRQFYDELDAEELQDLLGDYEPTLAGVMFIAERCTTYFSDDVPGRSYPQRLSLTSFINSGFTADEAGACSGLRYLDIRDTGYLASVSLKWFNEPGCDKVSSSNLGTLKYVWYDLICSTDIGEDPADE